MPGLTPGVTASAFIASAAPGQTTNNQFNTVTSQIRIGFQNNTGAYDMKGALRVGPINCPRYSTINSASLRQVMNNGTAALTIVKGFQDAKSPAIPTSYADFVARTISGTTQEAKSAPAAGAEFFLDYVSQIQAAVNRSDWASGDYVVLFIYTNAQVGPTVNRWFIEGPASGTQSLRPTFALDYTPPPDYVLSGTAYNDQFNSGDVAYKPVAEYGASGETDTQQFSEATLKFTPVKNPYDIQSVYIETDNTANPPTKAFNAAPTLMKVGYAAGTNADQRTAIRVGPINVPLGARIDAFNIFVKPNAGGSPIEFVKEVEVGKNPVLPSTVSDFENRLKLYRTKEYFASITLNSYFAISFKEQLQAVVNNPNFEFGDYALFYLSTTSQTTTVQNLLLQSEDLTTSPWNIFTDNLRADPVVKTPDGSAAFEFKSLGVGEDYTNIQQDISGSFSVGNRLTAHMWVKKGTHDSIVFRIFSPDAAKELTVRFNFDQNGVPTVESVIGQSLGTSINPRVLLESDGWYRLTIECNLAFACTTLRYNPRLNYGVATLNSMYLWRTQLIISNQTGLYIRTKTAAVANTARRLQFGSVEYAGTDYDPYSVLDSTPGVYKAAGQADIDLSSSGTAIMVTPIVFEPYRSGPNFYFDLTLLKSVASLKNYNGADGLNIIDTTTGIRYPMAASEVTPRTPSLAADVFRMIKLSSTLPDGTFELEGLINYADGTTALITRAAAYQPIGALVPSVKFYISFMLYGGKAENFSYVRVLSVTKHPRLRNATKRVKIRNVTARPRVRSVTKRPRVRS